MSPKPIVLANRTNSLTRCQQWNQLYDEHRYSIWSTKLVPGEDGTWQLADDLVNLITVTDLDAPFGKADMMQQPENNFDIASHGIAFSARQIKKGVRQFYASSPWYVSVDDFTKTPTAAPRHIQGGSSDGSFENIRFTPDGEKIAFLYHPYEDWFNSKLLICTPDDLNAFDVYSHILGIPESDDADPPASFEFAGCSDKLITGSHKNGRAILSSLELKDGAKPQPLTKSGSVTAVFPLVHGNWDRLLVTSSSFVDSSTYSIVNWNGGNKVMSSLTKYGTKYGLDWDEMVEEFWYEGADGLNVQCWMIKPMGFDEKKKYPWIFLPHGGPVSAWTDAWSTRVSKPPLILNF